MRKQLTRWAPHVLAPLLLLGGYVALWRPVRALFVRHVVYPALVQLATDRAATFAIETIPRAVLLRPMDGDLTISYTAPAGALFILPALLLVAIFPRKPYWSYFLLFHVGVGLLSFGVLYVGLGWSSGGFTVHRFLQLYVVPAISLAVFPATLLFARRHDMSEAPTSPPSLL